MRADIHSSKREHPHELSTIISEVVRGEKHRSARKRGGAVACPRTGLLGQALTSDGFVHAGPPPVFTGPRMQERREQSEGDGSIFLRESLVFQEKPARAAMFAAPGGDDSFGSLPGEIGGRRPCGPSKRLGRGQTSVPARCTAPSGGVKESSCHSKDRKTSRQAAENGVLFALPGKS